MSRRDNIRKPSNTQCDTPGTVWLFGMIERNNIRNFNLVIFEDRWIEALERIMREHIKEGTTIVSEENPSYP